MPCVIVVRSVQNGVRSGCTTGRTKIVCSAIGVRDVPGSSRSVSSGMFPWIDYVNHDGCTVDEARALLAALVTFEAGPRTNADR